MLVHILFLDQLLIFISHLIKRNKFELKLL